MATYILRRLVFSIPVMFSVVLLVFLALHLAPGDPIEMLLPADTPFASPAQRAAAEQELRVRYGLDKPLHEQFFAYLGRVVTLDLGKSIRSGERIVDELVPRYQATMELTVFAMGIAIVVGIGVGLLSALKPNTWLDSLLTTLALAGVSMPSFWLGLLLIIFFSLQLRWLPPSGRPDSAFTAEGFPFIIMPGLVLGIQAAGFLVRLTRSQMLEVLNEDYVRTARAKGLAERTVVVSHALRAALIPIVTVLGLQFGGLLAGALVAETVFAYPGVGRYLVQAVISQDFPAVQSGVLLVSLTFVVVNLLVDLAYAALDPRIQYGGR